jgi:DNA-binding protein HU-beta
MNKLELIDEIAQAADLSKAAAARSLNAVLDVITNSLKSNEDVTLVGFGAFKVHARAARKGRNPRTGEEIQIKATKVPVFRPGKALKEIVQKNIKK